MSKLCVSITEPDAAAVISAMKSLPPQVDIAEIRLDSMAGDYPRIKRELEIICRNRDRPVIVTKRPLEKCGHAAARDDQKRLMLLKDAADMGAEYVDIELESLPQLSLADLSARTIVSYHNFEETPEDLELIYRQCHYSGADVIKIATMATDISDSSRMLGLMQKHSGASTPLTALCMGEEGLPTRVLAPKFRGYLSFASMTPEKNSAPGQIPWRDMLDLYRFKQIDKNTCIYGVAANPVAHSMSPAIHNRAFAHSNVNATYLPMKVKDPITFLDAFQRLGLKGLSVTIPHKEAMIPLMDEIDDIVERVGALNTVNITDGRRFGYNTDVAAALGALRSALEAKNAAELKDCRVLLLGAGGAGRALAFGLADSVKELIIANRTISRAQKLASEAGAKACGLSEMEACRPDIIINTTSVGMHPDTERSPAPKKMLSRRPLVFDAVYNPIQTRLLRDAREAGCVTASGFDWFVAQAAEQFRIWTGKQPPREIMADVVREKLDAFV